MQGKALLLLDKHAVLLHQRGTRRQAVLPAWDRREVDSGVLAMGTGSSSLPPFHTASRSSSSLRPQLPKTTASRGSSTASRHEPHPSPWEARSLVESIAWWRASLGTNCVFAGAVTPCQQPRHPRLIKHRQRVSAVWASSAFSWSSAAPAQEPAELGRV